MSRSDSHTMRSTMQESSPMPLVLAAAKRIAWADTTGLVAVLDERGIRLQDGEAHTIVSRNAPHWPAAGEPGEGAFIREIQRAVLDLYGPPPPRRLYFSITNDTHVRCRSAAASLIAIASTIEDSFNDDHGVSEDTAAALRVLLSRVEEQVARVREVVGT